MRALLPFLLASVLAPVALVAQEGPPLHEGEHVRLSSLHVSNPRLEARIVSVDADSVLLTAPPEGAMRLRLPLAGITSVEHRFPDPHRRRIVLSGAAIGALVGVVATVAVAESRGWIGNCEDCSSSEKRRSMERFAAGGAVAGGLVGIGIGLRRSADEWRVVWSQPDGGTARR